MSHQHVLNWQSHGESKTLVDVHRGFGSRLCMFLGHSPHETLALPGAWREPCPLGQTAGQASRQNRHLVFTDSAGLKLETRK